MTNKQLIMIDDDEDDFLLLQAAFRYHAVPVRLTWFDSPFAFLESQCWEQQPVDMLVMDLRIGSETAHFWQAILGQHPCCQDVPIVIYSGSEAPGDREQLLQDGVTDFIPKVDTAAELNQVVERMLTHLA